MDAPPLLASQIGAPPRRTFVQGHISAYSRHWQVPAATEMTACDAMMALQHNQDLGFDYVGFPWATLIDGLSGNAAVTWDLLRTLSGMTHTRSGQRGRMRRATVAQHIRTDRYIELLRAAGITDLFWSHALTDQPKIGGITIHPFPLFPAQTPDGPDAGDLHSPRRYLANFIGAYAAALYLTDIRAHIFADQGAPDLRIIKRDAWHFQRAVYAEQIKGISPEAGRLAIENQHKTEYLDAIRQSTFTLCPTGSGPNSIRICEALALGSIPIILTRTLALPGRRALWDAACLFEEDSAAGYRRAIAQARAMEDTEIRRRQVATQALFAAIGPPAYARLILQGMALNGGML